MSNIASNITKKYGILKLNYMQYIFIKIKQLIKAIDMYY